MSCGIHRALIPSINMDFRNWATCVFVNLCDFHVTATKGHRAVVSPAFELRSTFRTSFKKAEYKLDWNLAADYFFYAAPLQLLTNYNNERFIKLRKISSQYLSSVLRRCWIYGLYPIYFGIMNAKRPLWSTPSESDALNSLSGRCSYPA